MQKGVLILHSPTLVALVRCEKPFSSDNSRLHGVILCPRLKAAILSEALVLPFTETVSCELGTSTTR